TARGEDQLTATRASLEAKASRLRAQLELGQAEYTACQDRAAQAAPEDPVDCSGYARAVQQNSERLEQIRLWQQRLDAEAGEFSGIGGRFAGLLEKDVPRVPRAVPPPWGKTPCPGGRTPWWPSPPAWRRPAASGRRRPDRRDTSHD